MLTLKNILITLFVMITGFYISFSQGSLPKDYFASPLEIPILLSGTFGELRSNHFHAGIDIKTQAREGLKVKASAEGYVSRIKIQRYGYGKALYITHPNGYQTVYGHLKKFAPKIENFIKKYQYDQEKYEIEVFPQKDALQVSKQEVIAFSGNTGSSGGPHLHFEIRDSQSRPMNPLLFGFRDIKDSKPPSIKNLYAYTANNNSHINNEKGRVKLKLTPIKNGEFRVPEIKAAGDIYFGIQGFDQQDLTMNKNGYYEVEAKLNAEPIYRAKFDKFSFSNTRYLNRLIDYGFFKEFKKRIHQLRTYDYKPLPIHHLQVNQGIVSVDDSLNYNYQLTVKDFKGNSTKIHIPITYKAIDTIQPYQELKTDFYISHNNSFALEEGIIDLYIPKNALYKDQYLNICVENETLKLHDYRTPIHKSITIGFDVSKYSEEDQKELFIARKMPWGDLFYTKTNKKRNRFTANIKTFGTYTLSKDETPPTIKALNFRNKQWLSKFRYLKVKIDDTISGIDSYRATINNKFILMEYDYKTKTLVYDFNDGIISDTENNFKLIVIDNVGNTSIFETTFFRKSKS